MPVPAILPQAHQQPRKQQHLVELINAFHGAKMLKLNGNESAVGYLANVLVAYNVLVCTVSEPAI